jgi:hypothetical protein
MKSKLRLKSQWHTGSFRSLMFICLLTLTQLFFVSVPINSQTRGAQMPYIRYESEDAVLGGSALLHGPTYDQTQTASEASNRKYVSLDNTGDYVKWVVSAEAEGMVLRFSIPDSTAGGGINRSLSLYVNGTHVTNLSLTSKYAWQYFDVANNPSNAPSVGRPRMRFDEYRMVLPDTLFAGDTIKLQRDAADTAAYYGIDFIELEKIPAEITKPAGYLSVTDYGAIPDNGTSDLTAFNNAISAASSSHTGLYIPNGKYDLNGVLTISPNVTMVGAGIWYTELHFMSSASGGITGNGSNIKISNLYLTSENTQRQTYRGFGGLWGTGSTIDSVWLTHFETGAWIANYSSSTITNGLVISHCRIRNTYADGCNFARGTRNSILDNCSLRNTGDDAMATWSSDSAVSPACFGNIFRYNTVENTYRANGLGIYGGHGYTAHHCIIKDNLYDCGIKLNSVFPAHLFGTQDYINIYDMTLDRTSPTTDWNTSEGAISIDARYYNVGNIKFDTIDINATPHNGIFIHGENGFSVNNVHFSNINMNNVSNYGIYVVNGTTGWGAKSDIVFGSPASGNIYNNGPFILKDEGIEILTINHTGMGSVTLDPPGGSYATGATISLTAVPDATYKFDSWSGGLTGTVNPSDIIMNDYKTVTANFSLISGFDETSKDNLNIECTPNPVSDRLSISLNSNLCTEISVLDYTGRVYTVIPVNSASTNYQIDFKNLPKGIYLLKINSGNGTVVKKIIKN